ncbi:MAG: hypothetical protein AMXMBFR13_04510 [Phycisphaerae bacterium]
MHPATDTTVATLSTVSGPSSVSLPLQAPGPITIGRSEHNSLCLNDPRVSREHAVLTSRASGESAAPPEWLLMDGGSRHGTWLNGVRIGPGRQVPVHAGDLITIPPWTFRLESSGPRHRHCELATTADAGVLHSTIQPLEPRPAESLARERLALLLECASAIHSATRESDLADVLLEAALSGTGYANAAMLGPPGPEQQVPLIAFRGEQMAHDPRVSHSLIREAAGGTPARLLAETPQDDLGISVAQLDIVEALCIPLLVGEAVAGFLYLDNRGLPGAAATTSDASTFAMGLARLAGLALANLRRLDVERRHARVEAELQTAGEFQALLMPRCMGTWGPYRYAGETRPGRFVGGDFFDVIPLADGRLAIAVGDVAGKSLASSVFATVSLGFLRAAIEQHGDAARAAIDLNRFLHPRCPTTRFLTLWLGLFDPSAGTLTCVDAGHGHAILESPAGTFHHLSTEGSCPIGILPDLELTAEVIELPRCGRAVIVSDGLIEERSPQTHAQFSMAGVQETLRSAPVDSDEVAALFTALQRHAGRGTLTDDATIAMIWW